jgi:hypothetical protein
MPLTIVVVDDSLDYRLMIHSTERAPNMKRARDDSTGIERPRPSSALPGLFPSASRCL